MSAITSVAAPASVGTVQPTSATHAARGPEPPPATSPAATRGISKTGDLMQKLQKLLQQDPASFQGMMSKLAFDLKTSAGKASAADASFLSKLGDSFALAGDSKSLEPLRPSPAQGPPSTSLGSYAQGGHRAGAGILKTFVSNAVAQVQMVLSHDDEPPIPPAPVQ